MAVEHMVWIKFNDGVEPARMQQHLDKLQALQGRVPGVQRIVTGTNFTDRANGYTHGLMVTLDDRDALDTYASHPEHVAVAGALKQDADLLAMDIDV